MDAGSVRGCGSNEALRSVIHLQLAFSRWRFGIGENREPRRREARSLMGNSLHFGERLPRSGREANDMVSRDDLARTRIIDDVGMLRARGLAGTRICSDSHLGPQSVK
jgi:hypothetical protein